MADVQNDLWSLLGKGSERAGTGPFLTDLRDGRVRDYGALTADARGWSAYLAAAGVGPSDRVAYVTVNRYRFFPLLLGCAARGAALIPLDERLHPDEMQSILRGSDPSLILYDGAPPHIGKQWQPAMDVDPDPEAGEVLPVSPDTEALVIYTSGTTSRSKGVMLTHRNLTCGATTFSGMYGYLPGDRFLCVLPFYHLNAPVVTGLACMLAGAHVFLSDPYGFTNAKFLFEFVQRHRLNVLSITPSIMASQLQLNPRGTDADLSSLRYALVGTAHLPESLWRRFEETFGVPCYQGYGLTETTTWNAFTPPDARKRYDTAGVPAGCEMRVNGEEEGEILIRGDIVMKGYLGAKRATNRSFLDDWFRTGDIGRFDSDGQLRIVGRIKNIIKRKGELIHPEEIDEALRSLEGVVVACTVGLDDEMLGERVVAAVEAPGGDAVALRSRLRDIVSPHKLPDAVVVVRRIPRNPVGKPDLRALRALLSAGLAKEIVQAFSRSKYARARSPDHEEILRIVQERLIEERPLRFVGYWGVGNRPDVEWPDLRTLERLREILDSIDERAGRRLTELTLVLADVHGRCNEVPEATMQSYFDQVIERGTALGFEFDRLSDHWTKAGLDFRDVTGAPSDEEFLARWRTLPQRDMLIRQASPRCPPGRSPEEHAQRYYRVCMAENPFVARAYEGWVSFTYNGPEYKPLLPDLPLVCWHSRKRGVAHKPWALDEVGEEEG